MTKELLKQALEALEEGYRTHTPEFKNVTSAIRAALAAPEADDVTSMDYGMFTDEETNPAAPAVQPLTDEQIEQLRLDICDLHILGHMAAYKLAHAAIAKFCEVNGIAASERKP